MIFQEGQSLAEGRYCLESFIAHGGMAEVWRARHLPSGKTHAIKVLTPKSLSYPDLLERFRLEFELLERLQHPHIIRVHEQGSFFHQGNKLPWFSMDYYPTNMRQRLTQISIGEGLNLLLPVLEALHYAHSQNICHRDLKPMNILVDAEGRAVLTDFGIAKETDRDRNLTGRNIIGTAYYISPEQCMGMKVTPQSDIYAFGVILYQLCTGHFPFEDSSEVAIIRRHISEPPRAVQETNPAVSADLGDAIDACLRKKPEERFATALDLIQALRRCEEMREVTQHVLAPGQKFMDGRYEILRLIDQGGFAEVYRVRHADTGKRYALKICLPALAYDQEMLKRFQREIQIMRALDHPYIMKVIDAGHHAYNNLSLPFFVMRYYPGNLQAALGQPVDPEKALTLLMDVLEALAYAHAFEGGGVLHRDLKPSNIMISSDGHGYLTDFGIAKISKGVSSLMTRSATMTRAAVGTSYYMSPEQIKNEPLDQRSDLYSMGIILYEILTGRRPYDAKSSEQIIAMHLYEKPPPPRKFNPMVTPKLQAVVMKCLEKDRDKRFEGIPQLIQALSKCRRGDKWVPTGAPIAGMMTKLRAPAVAAGRGVAGAIRSPLTYWGAAGLAAGLVLAVGGAAVARGTLGRELPPETPFFSAESLSYAGAIEPARRLEEVKQSIAGAKGESAAPPLPEWRDPAEAAFLAAGDQPRYQMLKTHYEGARTADPLDALRAQARMTELLGENRPALRFETGGVEAVQTNQETGSTVVRLAADKTGEVAMEYEWKLVDGAGTAVKQGRGKEREIALNDIPVGEYQVQAWGVYQDFKTNVVEAPLVVSKVDKPVEIQLAGEGAQQRVEFSNYDAQQFGRYEWDVRPAGGGPALELPASTAGQSLQLAELPDGNYQVRVLAYDADPALTAPYPSQSRAVTLDRTPPVITAREARVGAAPIDVAADQVFTLLPSDSEITLQLAGQDGLAAPEEIVFRSAAGEALPGGQARLRWNPDARDYAFEAADPHGNVSQPFHVRVNSVGQEFANTLAAYQQQVAALKAGGERYARAAALVDLAALNGVLTADNAIDRAWLAQNAEAQAARQMLESGTKELQSAMARDDVFATQLAALRATFANQPDAGTKLQAAQIAWQTDVSRPDLEPSELLQQTAGELIPTVGREALSYRQNEELDYLLVLAPQAALPAGAEIRFLTSQDLKKEGDQLAEVIDGTYDIFRAPASELKLKDPTSPLEVAIQVVLPDVPDFGELKGSVNTVPLERCVEIEEAIKQLITDYAGNIGKAREAEGTYARTLAWADDPQRREWVLDQSSGLPNMPWLIRHLNQTGEIERLRTEAPRLQPLMQEDAEWAGAVKAVRAGTMAGWADNHEKTVRKDLDQFWMGTLSEAAVKAWTAPEMETEIQNRVAAYSVQNAEGLLAAPPKFEVKEMKFKPAERLFEIQRDLFGKSANQAELALGWAEKDQAGEPKAKIEAVFDKQGVLTSAPPQAEREYFLASRWVKAGEPEWTSSWQRVGPLTLPKAAAAATPSPTPATPVATASPTPTATPQPTEAPAPAGAVTEQEAQALAAKIRDAVLQGRGTAQAADAIVAAYQALMAPKAQAKDSEFLTRFDARYKGQLKAGYVRYENATFLRKAGDNTFVFAITRWLSSKGSTEDSSYSLTLGRENGKVVILNDKWVKQ